ncbi:Ferredoxin-thioredoxin reductase, catalytic subunit [Geoglobus ahangari]|uniref:ferredoxin:thioredoxin reductase n=1 Tax=Geoglobus ahangari TaxID=113653 RepID=A0A0F7IG71_9EURY|nr:ferredoxin-thioredoxin reductase catalytic domain-containing protein [Geoglobus ahangari]AKG90857.1 Ferredoxin-thioredoxin reductase, catalytic subunit [Geoglobus ahangari]
MTPEEYVEVLSKVAERRGWALNPDKDIVLELARGLLTNRERYGIAYCPCRVIVGDRETDRKIVCPCVYAEADIREYGRCYCGLYVSRDVAEGEREIPKVIPDRHAEALFTSGR